MENKTKQTRNEALKALLENTNLDLLDYKDFETAEELIENMRTQISEDEVIYYSKAMEYLMENDNSLTESLAIAHELGYTADNINSELLATLLMQRNLEEELSGIEADINAIYND